MPKFRKNEEEVELEDDDERPDPAGTDEDSDDEDSKPKSKLKKKTKASVEVEEDEEPTPKKKVAAKKKVVETEDEDEETSKPKAKAKVKSVKAKKERKPRETNLEKYGIPYEPDTMIGKAFTLASRKEGILVEKLKALIEKNKQSKKGGYWVLTDLRKGEWRGTKWKVLDDGKESGLMKISFKAAA